MVVEDDSKYLKVDVLLKQDDLGTTKITFGECFIKITSNHLIIKEKSEDGTKIKNSIFKLDEIKAYQTITNKINN